MLKSPKHTKLSELGLSGMLAALEEQDGNTELYRSMDFSERLALLVEREAMTRGNLQLQRRLKTAKLRHSACLEDIDYRASRGLDKGQVSHLGQCRWVTSKQNILITGPTGVGKSFLACAFSHRACQDGYSAVYHRSAHLFSDALLARTVGKYKSWLRAISRVDVLVIDDFGLLKLNDEERTEMLEILEERHDRRSTIVTSQLPVDKWYETIGNPTLADAILDRLVHTAHRLELSGPSMRKRGKAGVQVDEAKTDRKG